MFEELFTACLLLFWDYGKRAHSTARDAVGIIASIGYKTQAVNLRRNYYGIFKKIEVSGFSRQPLYRKPVFIKIPNHG